MDDLPGIVRIYNSTIPLRCVTADTEEVSVESRKNWFDEHDSVHRPLWIIEDEEKNMVGWCSFQNFYGRPAYAATAELSIYLNEHCRGKGIGKQVVQHCIDAAPSLGIKTLVGFVFEHNIPSLKVCERMGFIEWGMMPKVADVDGVEYSLKILGKRLS